ncbi:hypothetical protein [Pseudomonas syringae]|nr:hypothetical protein [Pseudomonas syringae]
MEAQWTKAERHMISGQDNDKLRRLINEFHDESDRGCAVITICVLEEKLLELLEARVPKCSASELRNLAPLGRLSLSVDNAYLVGVLSERNRTEFKQLIKIRNMFAHKPLEGLSFLHHDIIHLCSKLILCDMVDELILEDARHRYVCSVVMLYLSLHHELEELERITELPDRGFVFED